MGGHRSPVSYLYDRRGWKRGGKDGTGIQSKVDQTELPYSLEAEQTILGSIFVDASVLSVVLERTMPDSFFNEQHKALFQIIMQMFTSGEKIDIVTVLNAAMAGHIFDTAAEGRAYLGHWSI